MLGNVDGTIEVAIPHTVKLTHTLDDVVYEANLNLPNYSKPDPDKTYILFLKKAQTKDVFTPATVPFQIEVNSAGRVALKANTENNELALTTKKSDTIKFQFEQIDIALIDKVTGLTKDELIGQIKTEVIAK